MTARQETHSFASALVRQADATNLARLLLETVSGRLWTCQMGPGTERLQPVQL